MSTTLERLLVLQDRDRKISRLLRESKDVPARKKHIESRIREQREALAHHQEELKKRTSAAKQVELEVDARNEKIAKLREQQFQVKSNADYRTLEKEIKALEGEIKDLEDQELAVMEQMEETKRTMAEASAALRQGEEEVQTDIRLLDKRMESIDVDIQTLQREREDLAGDIDPDWLSRYDRIFRHTGDYGLVPIDDNGICGGCHMKLPAHLVHDAKKALSMATCSYCGRMLYWQA